MNKYIGGKPSFRLSETFAKGNRKQERVFPLNQEKCYFFRVPVMPWQQELRH